MCGGAPSPCISRNGNVDFCGGAPSPCISRNGDIHFYVMGLPLLVSAEMETWISV